MTWPAPSVPYKSLATTFPVTVAPSSTDNESSRATGPSSLIVTTIVPSDVSPSPSVTVKPNVTSKASSGSVPSG